jgi:hypothetical protein
MNANGELAFPVQFAIDVELEIVRHVAEVGDAELTDLGERIFRLLNAAFAREGARDDAVEKW